MRRHPPHLQYPPPIGIYRGPEGAARAYHRAGAVHDGQPVRGSGSDKCTALTRYYCDNGCYAVLSSASAKRLSRSRRCSCCCSVSRNDAVGFDIAGSWLPLCDRRSKDRDRSRSEGKSNWFTCIDSVFTSTSFGRTIPVFTIKITKQVSELHVVSLKIYLSSSSPMRASRRRLVSTGNSCPRSRLQLDSSTPLPHYSAEQMLLDRISS